MPPSGHQYHKGQLLPSCSFFWTSCYRNMLLHFDSVQTFTPLKTGAAQQSRDNMESICLILIFLFLFIYLFLLQWTGGRELGRDQMGSVGFMGHATAGGRGYCLDHTVTTHNQSLSAKTKFKLPLYGTLMFCNVACRVLQCPLVVAMNLVINRKPGVTARGGCGWMYTDPA